MTTPSSERWSDLTARVGSALAMIVVGLGGIYLGGPVFHVLVALICGVMAWELVGMLNPSNRGARMQMGLLVGAASLASKIGRALCRERV